MKKNMKGITLVSLVITIIVMLILAGVSIQMATGDNGVLSRGQQGAVKTKLASVLEELNSAVLSLETDYKSQYILESSMEAKKSDYFTVGLVGTDVDSVETATKSFMKNHKGLNNYLTSCQILEAGTSTTVKNAGGDISVTVNNKTDSLTKIAGQTAAKKAYNSNKSEKTNCGYKLSALYLTNGSDPTAVNGDLYCAIYYIKKSIPTFVDVAIIEATGTGFKNGTSGLKEGAKKGELTIVGPTDGVTWLNNSEGLNT